jgi:hypothetical protein
MMGVDMDNHPWKIVISFDIVTDFAAGRLAR